MQLTNRHYHPGRYLLPPRARPPRPWKGTLSGVQELFHQGAFKRLGVSNFLAHGVDEIIRVGKKNKFIPPSIYQGNCSPVAPQPKR